MENGNFNKPSAESVKRKINFLSLLSLFFGFSCLYFISLFIRELDTKIYERLFLLVDERKLDQFTLLKLSTFQ